MQSVADRRPALILNSRLIVSKLDSLLAGGMFGETEIPSDSCPSLFPYHVPHAEQDKSISRNPKIFLLVVVMFFQQLGRLIIFTELLTSLVSADQLDSVSDASSIPSVETSNSIFRSSTLSTETIPANSQPWLSLSSPGHDSEILLSDNIAQKACTQPSKSRKRRRDGAGEGVNLCKPEWFKPEKKDQAVDKTTQDIMSMFDPKKWEQVMRDSMRLKWLNELFLPEDRRKCKYHPFVVHLCCNGPFGDRLLGVQALGDYYAFINDCVSCKCIVRYSSSLDIFARHDVGSI